MNTMIDVFLAVLPVFVIIGVGMLVDRAQFLPEGLSTVLSAYVLRLALPVLMVWIMCSSDPATLFNGGFWCALLLAQFGAYALGYGSDALFRRRGQGPAALTGLACSCCNVAFLGIPVVISLLPGNQEALLAAGIASVVTSVVMVSGQVHLELLRQKALNTSGGLASLLVKAVLLNPLFMGLAVGMVLCLSGIGLWGPLERTAALISQTCAPCALIVLGLDMRNRVRVARASGTQAAPHQSWIALVKLILNPLLAWLLLWLFGVDGQWLAVGVIMSGTTTAVAVYMIAEYYRTVPEESALAVVVSHACSLFTVSGFAYIFKVLGML